MKMTNLILALSFALPVTTWARGGDVGGGGTLERLQRAFRLPPAVVEDLRRQGNESQVYQRWLQTLSAQQRQELVDKVFEYHILPQVEGE